MQGHEVLSNEVLFLRGLLSVMTSSGTLQLVLRSSPLAKRSFLGLSKEEHLAVKSATCYTEVSAEEQVCVGLEAGV